VVSGDGGLDPGEQELGQIGDLVGLEALGITGELDKTAAVSREMSALSYWVSRGEPRQEAGPVSELEGAPGVVGLEDAELVFDLLDLLLPVLAASFLA